MCSYSTISGKFDFDRLNGKYQFNTNYLIKMRFDLDFLYQTHLGIFFNFAESSDPFLHAVSHEDIANGKIAIPVGDDIFQAIHLCQYSIMQDIIFYQMQGENQQEQFGVSTPQMKKEYDYRNANVNTGNSKSGNQTVEKSISERVAIQSKIKGKNSNCNGSDTSYNNGNNSNVNLKKITKNEREVISVVSRDDIAKKLEQYDLLQKHLEIDRELIGKRKEDLSKERELDEKKEQEIMKIDSENDKKENKDNNKKQKELQTKTQPNKETDNDDDKVNINWLNIGKNEIENKNEQMQPQESKSQLQSNNNKSTFPKKQHQQSDNQLTVLSPKQPRDNQEIIPRIPHHNDSPIQSSRSLLNNSMRRSLTPKSHAKQLQQSLKLSYYTGDLDDFLPFYNKHYQSISQEQRIIFNIKEHPSHSITTTFNPKIIICTSSQNKYDIKGFCVLSFDIENNSLATSAAKINILHLSSIKQNEDIILSALIDYIKETIYCSQIDIDLYYKFEDNKFTINKELRDLFKNDLGFRWSRLENLAQHIRYQKMYLKICQENPIMDNYSLLVSKPLFNIKHCSVITLTLAPSQQLNINNDTEDIRFDKYMNAFTVVYSMNWLRNNTAYAVSLSTNNSTSKGNWFNWDVKPNEGCVNCSIGDYNQKKSLMNDNDINHLFNETKAMIGTEYISSFMQLSPYFNSNISSIIDNVYYNRLQGQIKQLRHKDTNQVFYLLPTVDGLNSVFICQMNALTKQALVENETNVYQAFNAFYHQIEPIEEKDDVALWLPSFEIDTHLATKQFGCVDEITIQRDDKDVHVSVFDEYIKVGFDYDSNSHAAFSVKVRKEDVVIKDAFLLGVINLNVLSSFEFSTVLLLNVTKEHWRIKKK